MELLGILEKSIRGNNQVLWRVKVAEEAESLQQ